MSAVKDARKSFILWVSNEKNPLSPLSESNTQDHFVIQYPLGWNLPGTWSAEVISVTCSEVDHTKTKGDLLLYTSFAESSLVGHGMYPLMDRIGYTGSTEIRHQDTRFPIYGK